MRLNRSGRLRRLMSLLLLAAGLLMAFPALAASGVRYVYTENGGSLNLRDQAGKNGSIIERLPQGTRVTLREEGTTWSKVTCGDRTGYVMTRYLRSSRSTKPESAWKKASGSMYVDTANRKPLHLRQKASRSSKSLGLFENGTRVSVSETSDTWAHVKAGEQEGYMMLSYLTKEKPVSNGNSGRLYVRGTGSAALYREMDSGSQVLLRVPGGTGLNVCGENGKWVQTTVQGITGYMQASALTSEAPNTGSGKEAVVVNPNGASYVNLRFSPGMKSADTVLAHIRVNTRVQVLGRKGSWRRILWGDLVGYVHHTFLQTD